MRDHDVPPRGASERRGSERLSQRADLIRFQKEGVAKSVVDRLLDPGRVRDGEIVPDDLEPHPPFVHVVKEHVPGKEVILFERVFERDDRVLRRETHPVFDELLWREPRPAEIVRAILVELARCRVEGDHHRRPYARPS